MKTLRAFYDNQALRYLLAGGWNTLFGYLVGVALYYGFSGRLHVVVVGVVGNVLSITMAFLTYKLFVFRTRGMWVSEYLRAYVVYGAMAVLGVIVLWGFVDGMHVPFWLAQGLTVVITVVVSFVGHRRFTFRRTDHGQNADLTAGPIGK